MIAPYRKPTLGSQLEKDASKWAEEQGWFTFKVEKASKRGVPDRFYARAGRVVFVEFKGPRETVKPQQERRIADLVAAGVQAWVCRDMETFKSRMR